MAQVQDFVKNKTILITGGAGSIGNGITRRVIEYGAKVVRVFDIDETRLIKLEDELRSKRLRIFIGDIRDKDRLKRAIEGVDIVYHVAALKHVPICEYNPFEATKTNVLGTQNLLEVAIDEEIEKFITISTDKATYPINVLGATKLLAERLTISANLYKGSKKTAFACVRFGNVLHSRGSVFPLFEEQIKKGGPVTLTNPNMTRFIMKLSQTVELILKASKIAKGGEIFILKMPSVRIQDLAKVMIEEFASKSGYRPEEIKIKITEKRPGEKIFEELMTLDEVNNAFENEEMFIISPKKLKNEFKKVTQKKSTSENGSLLNIEDIRILVSNNLENQ